MKKNIYIIEYEGSKSNEYALSYEAAKEYLEGKGYKEVQALDVDQNNAGCFVRPEDDFFARAEARIITGKLI